MMSDDRHFRGRRSRSVTIELQEPCPRWREKLPRRRQLCTAAAEAACAAAKPRLKRRIEVSVVLADDNLLRRLNRRWLRLDKPTNVLAFPALDEEPFPSRAPLLLGDVVLSFETVSREAAEQNKPLADHVRHLVVHGVLHLLGYDHEEPIEAERMEALETEVLADLGVADPYTEREAAAHE
jgi:probable rRNA maturation factor